MIERMSMAFSLPVKCIIDEDGVPFQIVDSYGDLMIDGENTCEETNYGLVALAINSHDKLNDEVSRLTKIAAQKATRCDELYEALEDAADLLFQSNDKELRDYGMTIRKLLAKETKK